MNEQTAIKLPGAEIKYGMLHDPMFWLLIAAGVFVVWLWRRK